MTAFVGAAIALQAGAQQSFKVRLRPVPIEASTAANTIGAGEATAQLAGTKLTVRGNFAGLKGSATVAQLHQGPVMGVRGPAIADLTVPSATSGNFSAEVTLTAAQVEGLRQGHVYLQIHSETAPDGNLWGWLLP
ncbi:MAG TPA: CHRD domain-containing protein [Gammaproteobacteria bacterium]|nr:CHRD domain-containing protein [Gammaproteobacteria bacterium]